MLLDTTYLSGVKYVNISLPVVGHFAAKALLPMGT